MTADFKPSDLPTLVPYLAVKDGNAALNFYQTAFGFSLRSEPMSNEHGVIGHCEIESHGAVVMFAPEGQWGDQQLQAPKTAGAAPSVSLYIYCPDVDVLYKQAIAAGAISASAPADSFWGDRYCVLLDIDGYMWTFATKI